MKTSDIDVERNILRCLVQLPDFIQSVLLYGQVVENHFSDLFHQNSFNAIKFYYNKFGTPPTQSKLKSTILQFITYDKRYETEDKKYSVKTKQRDIWLKSVERLFVVITADVIREKESDLAMLEEMRKVRLLQ